MLSNDGKPLTLEDWEESQVKVRQLVAEQEVIMARAVKYGYDEPSFKLIATEEFKRMRDEDFRSMNLILAELKSILWRFSSLL